MASSGQQGPSPDGEPCPERYVSSKSLEESFLQCSVCLEKFDSNLRSPRQLSCHHTFCLQCLKSIAENERGGGFGRNSLHCPTCRQEHNLGQGGINQLPSDHKIVQLMDFLSMNEEKSHDTCVKHRQQPLNFFCKTCEVSVCRDCTVVSHNQMKGHEVMEIAEALTEFTPRFNNTIDRANEALEKFQARLQFFNKAMEELTKNQASVESKIRETFAGYRAQLVVQENALLSQLGGGVVSNRRRYMFRRNTATVDISTIRVLIDDFKKARTQQDIKMLYDLVHQLEQYLQTNDDYNEKLGCFELYKYEPQNEVAYREIVGKLGNIGRIAGQLQ